jgi:predicted nucleic acid-binding protein
MTTAILDTNVLITNDRQHLLPLRQYRNTRIVTPAQFLVDLGQV